ncbi:MAG: putative rane protein [Paenibacillus sp.]|jgi:putative membrane protein|nr:putative rane protein [Paenibacillus sp.]
MQILPAVSTAFIVISAIFVACGWFHIVKGNREAHQKLMLWGAGFALAFFVVYMSRTIFTGNTSFGGPEELKLPYHLFLFFHIALATSAAVFGVITLLHAFNKRFAKHKKIGRWTAVVWLLTAPTGVAVYILLYVLYPGGETKPMIDAILGT